jgi:hypothetical protein
MSRDPTLYGRHEHDTPTSSESAHPRDPPGGSAQTSSGARPAAAAVAPDSWTNPARRRRSQPDYGLPRPRLHSSPAAVATTTAVPVEPRARRRASQRDRGPGGPGSRSAVAAVVGRGAAAAPSRRSCAARAADRSCSSVESRRRSAGRYRHSSPSVGPGASLAAEAAGRRPARDRWVRTSSTTSQVGTGSPSRRGWRTDSPGLVARSRTGCSTC